MKLKWSAIALTSILSACALRPPAMTAEEYSGVEMQVMSEISEQTRVGALRDTQARAAQFYLLMQQRIPDIPADMHAYYKFMVENAGLVDRGTWTVEQLLTNAELRRLEVARTIRAINAEQERLQWAAAARAIADAYKQPPTVNCTSYSSGNTTQTRCQ